MMRKKYIQFILILTVVFLFNYCSSSPKKIRQVPDGPEVAAAEGVEETVASDVDAETVNGEVSEKEEVVEDPAKILEDALETYQEALTAWEKSDADQALVSLDEAYNLILQIKVSAESPLNQEKSNLRLLIAQRIQEIYASHFNSTGANHKFIQLVENEYVMREIKSFQNRERRYFEESYARSGRYREMMKLKLRNAGLPEELSWIPLIESGFKIRAYSHARALGLWQFISSTGYRFGLKKDRWIDERMDPEKATDAAVQYLKELHSYFGDWATALASYNCGEFRVQRLIRAQRVNYLDNFWDLYVMLPRETRRFVPRYIATLLIVGNPEKYGFTLPQPQPSLKYESISSNRPIKLSVLSQKIGLEAGALADLNPELRHKSTPDRDYQLKVPVGKGESTLALLSNLPKWIPPEATYVIHYVRRGETVSGIARRYRTSVSAIARMNRLRRNFLIRPGQRLKVPSRGRRYSSSSPAAQQPKNVKPPAGAQSYTVVAGDTLYTIAQKFNMKLRKLMKINRMGSRSRIYPGQTIWVFPNPAS